ncbi:MAG: PolC-type DNA polymerase III [Gemmatimonadales bacterium]
MIGLATYPDRTLADRAVDLLQGGPRTAVELATEVLGLQRSPRIIAERLAVALLGADPRVRQLPDGRWGAAVASRPTQALAECTFSVVDVETTGTRSAGGDRIMEIAVVTVCGGRVETVFDSLVNPERPIPRWASMVTGISQAMVASAPTFPEVADQVLGVLAGRVFVAHNARFDWSFVLHEIRRARAMILSGPRLCTVRLARGLLRGQVESCGLDSLTRYFGFENPARHRAGGDALVTAWLLARLIDLAAEQGAVTFDDLVGMQRRKKQRKSLG